MLYDGRATADKYLEWCEKGVYDEKVGDYVYYTTKDNGNGYILAKELHKKGRISPKFEQFADEMNYYKLLEDFDVYDTITGEHSPQGAVQMLSQGMPADYKDVLLKALKEEQKVADDFADHLENRGLKEEILEIVKKNGYNPEEDTTKVGTADAETRIKAQARESSKTDTDYLDAVERGDMETAQRMVDEAAKAAGYTQEVYHGTQQFGFTRIDVSKSDDKLSFFATDDIKLARTYSGTRKQRNISNKFSLDIAKEDYTAKVNELIDTLKSEYSDATIDYSEYSELFSNLLKDAAVGEDYDMNLLWNLLVIQGKN